MDFNKFGGSVVTYFWLIKLYGFISALVIAVYSVYLQVLTQQFCSVEEKCEELIVFWIVSNENLYKILKDDHFDIVVRLWTLRGMTYAILLIGNAYSLYLVGRFKRRFPQQKNLSSFAIIFKNVSKSPE